VLNQIAAHMLDATSDIIPNWKLLTPDPNVTIGRRCEPYKIEMVVRGYLTGHAWRTYQSGLRELCGVKLPEGLREHDRLPTPIITPTTKASEGHDEDISREQIIQRGIVSEAEYVQLESAALRLFERGTALAAARGLILVDTKYEFGQYRGTIMLMDEIHTPDSSRYFYANGYQERQNKGEQQKQLSKEFVREWLIANHFMGKEGQTIPVMDDDFVKTITNRYIELFEQVTGTVFSPQDIQNADARMRKNVEDGLHQLLA
ncbi:MAG: phosphoribosylaminoimidazolesuccinocarboxamide synthase, partial [Flavobacteriales bacterium]